MNVPIRTRSRRRAFVVLYALTLLFVYPLLFENFGLLAWIVFLVASPLRYKGSFILQSLRKAVMDEREKQIVAGAYVVAYEILCVTVVAVLFVNTLYPVPPSAFLQTLSEYLFLTRLLDPWSFLLVTLVLPPTVILWLEPDPVKDDLAAPSVLERQ